MTAWVIFWTRVTTPDGAPAWVAMAGDARMLCTRRSSEQVDWAVMFDEGMESGSKGTLQGAKDACLDAAARLTRRPHLQN